MVQAYLGGRRFDVLHPIPVAVTGSTEWHFGISLKDLATAATVSDTERGKPDRWQDGYEDGQRLAFHLELLRTLARCFVPVPPPGG